MKKTITLLLTLTILTGLLASNLIYASATTKTFYILNTPIVYNVNGLIDGVAYPLGTSYSNTVSLDLTQTFAYTGGEIKKVEAYRYTSGSLDFSDLEHVLRNETVYSDTDIKYDFYYNNYSDANITYGMQTLSADNKFKKIIILKLTNYLPLMT